MAVLPTRASQGIALPACVEAFPREEAVATSCEADAAQGGFVGYHYDGTAAVRIHRAGIASLPNGGKSRFLSAADSSDFELELAA